MTIKAVWVAASLLITSCASAPAQAQAPANPAPPVDILASAPASDWAPLDPENTLYMELEKGRVVIALAPEYAPNHVANVKALARAGYFDNAAIIRAQDNYVVQWSQPKPEGRSLGQGHATLPAEFDRAIAPGLQFTPLPDPDTYAREVGFSNGFAVARGDGRTWLTHCYAAVGAGRDVSPDSGGGAELYAIIGQSPRNLDRNVTLFGRIVQGIELLSVLPRGTGEIGFYETEVEYTPIRAIRVAADVPAAERTNLEMMRTDSASFAAWVESRRNRRDDWYVHAAGRIGVCNVAIPVRAAVR